VRSASITYMIRHYVARRAQVIEDHPHNADVSRFMANGAIFVLASTMHNRRRAFTVHHPVFPVYHQLLFGPDSYR
jgi:hypothetical protein